MKLEDILPQIRAGRKARYSLYGNAYVQIDSEGRLRDFYCDGKPAEWTILNQKELLRDDWELVPEPVRVADYLVEVINRTLLYHLPHPYWLKETHPIGQQPEGSVMVPGSERCSNV